MFSKFELEIMKLLWSERRELTKKEIVDLTPNKSWKPNTIHALLNNLLAKDAIQVIGLKRSGKVYSRTYIPVVTEEVYTAEHLEETLPQSVNLVGVFSAMVDREGVSRETLDELRKMIEKKIGELDQ